VGCVVDITAARELQREREARAVAEETGRRQAAFLSRVSHELRTPLNAILGFGQLLQPDLTASPRQAGYIGHIVKAGQHMLALVDDLLQLQRIEQGRFEPQRAPLRAVLLLETVVQMLGPMAQAAGVTLRGEADEGLVLDSDERCLRQILLNLGSNAVKYGRRGGQVVLAARAQAAGFVIEVRDDGPGMDEAQLARLFRPFDRLGQESSTVAGSGLGLVISRQLAQALGGTLQISSRPGEGTCATLQVPAAPA
jgi:signal transduction histidine kinase